jgi:flagellar motility protein MotE (MotC chaperone)
MKKKQKKRVRKNNRGVLILITGFFLASGLLRLGSGTGSAIAREVEALRHNSKEIAQSLACQNDANIGELLKALKTREERISAQENKIADRVQALAVAKHGIDQKLVELVEAEKKLRATMALANTASEDDLSRLVSVYENMKPKDAAALFEEMEPRFSSGFLGRMRPDAAAKIFAGLTPAKAYSISVILAGRNAEVPTE